MSEVDAIPMGNRVAPGLLACAQQMRDSVFITDSSHNGLSFVYAVLWKHVLMEAYA